MLREGPIQRNGRRQQNITEPNKWTDEEYILEKFCHKAE